MDKRVDKGKEFEASGMTLITEVKSDYWLRKHQKQKKEVKYTERLDD